MKKRKAHVNSPKCPECKRWNASVPILGSPGSGIAGTLFCPACGHTWIATEDDFRMAQKADAAWDRVLARENKKRHEKEKKDAILRRYMDAPKVGNTKP